MLTVPFRIFVFLIIYSLTGSCTFLGGGDTAINVFLKLDVDGLLLYFKDCYLMFTDGISLYFFAICTLPNRINCSVN